MNIKQSDFKNLKSYLDEAYFKYNQVQFIENDPISLPHRFSKKEDIEISAFLIATISWGNRKSIIQNGLKLIQWMGEEPHDFICNYSKKDLKPFEKFVHRTFNGLDCIFFIQSLRNIYFNHQGLEHCFSKNDEQNSNIKNNLIEFRKVFFTSQHLLRSEKHISNPDKNSSAKRLCMFLRWMVRKDNQGVDFGIWTKIKPSQLCLPLDVHTGNVSRTLGLLKRTQNDWKAVEEITSVLKMMDPDDPIKYDFSLFGIGVNNNLKF